MFGIAWSKVKSAPSNGDLAAADAHEASEVDHRGLWLTFLADEYVDQAPDVLAVRSLDVVAEDRQCLLRRDLLHVAGRSVQAPPPSAAATRRRRGMFRGDAARHSLPPS